MAVPVTRSFTQADSTRLWEHLNEIRGWVDELGTGAAGAVALGTQDLDTLADGTYSQDSGAAATLAAHYPVADGRLLLQQWSWTARKAQLAILSGTTRVFARTSTSDVWTPWRELGSSGPRQAAGVVTVDIGGSVSGSAVINFPAGRFAVAPIIIPTLFRGGAASMMVPRVSSRSETQATITVTNVTNSATPSGTTAEVHWIAIQMTDTSAAG